MVDCVGSLVSGVLELNEGASVEGSIEIGVPVVSELVDAALFD